ncbi:hypothetical protein FRC15_002794 [Serendipita sp. 397]|nr:hypothetical protein FRC15_002794 [Serendipita sp. 397]
MSYHVIATVIINITITNTNITPIFPTTTRSYGYFHHDQHHHHNSPCRPEPVHHRQHHYHPQQPGPSCGMHMSHQHGGDDHNGGGDKRKKTMITATESNIFLRLLIL